MAVTFPGIHNTFVANHEATNSMVVDFSRDPKKFAVNRYAQLVPVKQTVGYYLNMTIEEAGRILNTDGSDLIWPDGNDAPTGSDGTESHEFLGYRCKRYAPSFRLGDLAVEQASWDIVAHHGRIKAQQCMTLRTQKVITVAQTAGNYDSSHTSDVASISGNTGTWAQSTTSRSDIKRSLNYAVEKILDDTLGGVDPEDLVLVMSSGCASKISLSQEIVDHIKQSPEALAQVRGELPGKNVIHGLPDRLYGIKVEVDITRKTTSKKGATAARSSVLAEGSPFICSRPGGLVGIEGSPSFSTISVFVYDKNEMLVETKNDQDNKRTLGRIIDTYDVVMTAPSSGFLFTSAT